MPIHCLLYWRYRCSYRKLNSFDLRQMEQIYIWNLNCFISSAPQIIAKKHFTFASSQFFSRKISKTKIALRHKMPLDRCGNAIARTKCGIVNRNGTWQNCHRQTKKEVVDLRTDNSHWQTMSSYRAWHFAFRSSYMTIFERHTIHIWAENWNDQRLNSVPRSLLNLILSVGFPSLCVNKRAAIDLTHMRWEFANGIKEQ